MLDRLSGYLFPRNFWRLQLVFGASFIATGPLAAIVFAEDAAHVAADARSAHAVPIWIWIAFGVSAVVLVLAALLLATGGLAMLASERARAVIDARWRWRYFYTFEIIFILSVVVPELGSLLFD